MLKANDVLEKLGIWAEIGLGWNDGGIQRKRITIELEDFLELANK